MTRPLFLVDLDDTLFQTRRKIPSHLQVARLASEATNGNHSFFTPSQAALVEWLFSSADVLPITARSRDAFARCRIPSGGAAVLSNGGLILGRDGCRDEGWHTRIVVGSERAASSMDKILEYGLTMGDVRGWIVREGDTPLYVCFKSNDDAEVGILDIIRRAGAREHPHLVAAQNGNNLSFAPAHVSKRNAVRYLLEEKGLAGEDAPIFGMGDSLSDLPFMNLCHFKVIPNGSQIDLRLLAGTDHRNEDAG